MNQEEYELLSIEDDNDKKIKYTITKTKNPPEIDEAVIECDAAYTISVINRENSQEIISKIKKHATTLLVRKESQIIGYACFYANNVILKQAYITLICIRPEYQNKHLGSALIQCCFNQSKEAGMETIRLEVLKQDIKAIQFYKSKGFIIESESDHESYYMKATLY